MFLSFPQKGGGKALVNNEVAECIKQLRNKSNEFCHSQSLKLTDEDFQDKCEILFDILEKIVSDSRREQRLLVGELEKYREVDSLTAITDHEVATFKKEIEELKVYIH